MLVASRLAIVLIIRWRRRLPIMRVPANSRCASCLVYGILPEVGVTKETRHDLPVFLDTNRLIVIITGSAVVHLLSGAVVVTLVLVIVVVPVLLALLLLFVPAIVRV